MGPDDQVIMDSRLSRFTDPRNQGAPHPLLQTLTGYMPNTRFGCYARKFFYNKRSRNVITLSTNDQRSIFQLLGHPVNFEVIPSKQFVVDQKVFGLKDVVSVVAGEATKKDKGKFARGNTTTSDQNR